MRKSAMPSPKPNLINYRTHTAYIYMLSQTTQNTGGSNTFLRARKSCWRWASILKPVWLTPVSDASVRAALRSAAALVAIEAPAGCGKTTQGADYARELVAAGNSGRLLILTHTHAACSVFADRTKAAGARVEIRTIDGVIANIASIYHAGLGLPADIAAWVRQRPDDGHADLALRVASLLKRYPMIASAMAQRYPVVICDEHQDSSGDQHSVIMALSEQGAKLRVFADPMQKIFKDRIVAGACPPSL